MHRTKPLPGTPIDRSDPLAPSLAMFLPYGPGPVAGLDGRVWSPVGSPKPAIVGGRGGAAAKFDGTQNSYSSASMRVPTTACTVRLIVACPSSASLGSTFGVSTLQGFERLQAHLPYSGTMYWDYGGNSAPNRLTWTPAAAFFNTNLHAMVFRAGTLGMAIWVDGERVASSATPVGRTESSDVFTLGQWAGNYNPSIVECMLLDDRELSDRAILDWTNAPYRFFTPRRTTRRYVQPVAFRPAWAAGTNTLIGAF